jgi:type II secretory pathway pseudopilin PulG
MNNSEFNIQNSIGSRRDLGFRTPRSALRTSHSTGGFTYVALLVAIVIIGISLGAAGKYWANMMQREREEELLFRGEQYRTAIERYFLAKLPNQYPASIEDLLSDGRFPQAKRHLRHQYKDPMTGEDFEIIKDKGLGNRIAGVNSTSQKTPFKLTGFPDQYNSFEGKDKYSDWKFIYMLPQQGQLIRPGTPAQPALPVPAPATPATGK